MWVSIEKSRFGRSVTSAVSKLSDILVPPTCLICDAFVQKQGGCCGTCWRELRFIVPPICPVLGSPFSIDLGNGIMSAEAIANPPPFERLRAVLLYDDLARRMVSLLKYSDRTDLAPWMASWMVVAGKELIEGADAIVPIPLYSGRLRSRRFNQSAELARHIADKAQIPFFPVSMKRKKNTRQQVGLTQSERQRNVSGAFVVPEERKIDVIGKRVILVDDVYTTGATTKAATRALKRAGASQVDVLVFAKVETTPV